MRTSKAKFVSKDGRGLVTSAPHWQFAKWDKIEKNKSRLIDNFEKIDDSSKTW